MSGEPVGWGTLLTPAEVAAIFNVDPKTVTSWSRAGKLSAVKTPGGHRRFPLSEVVELMARGSQQLTTPETVVLPVRPRNMADAHRHPSVQSMAMTGLNGTDEPSAAAAVVAEAVAVALEAQASIAAQEVVDVAEAVVAAARTAAAAAETAREARRAAAQLAAEDVARTATITAGRIQALADAAAVHQAAAAAEVAGVVAAASWPGHEREAALVALRLAAIVEAAAMTTAEATGAAAVAAADSVAAAAAEVAAAVTAADLDVEFEVASTAASVKGTAAATARRVAARSDARGGGAALVAHEAAAEMDPAVAGSFISEAV